MATEIRPVSRAETREYLRVLPFVNGMPQEEPEPAAWYPGRAAWPPQVPVRESDLSPHVDAVQSDWYRPHAAFVDGTIVGASGVVSTQITLPGRRQVALGGITSTGVLPTHRRRGLLRKIMTAMLQDCRERGEFLAGLSASEATIYGRYGFGPATFQHRWEMPRADAVFRDDAADTGSLDLVDASVAAEAWADLHEKVRADRVGEIGALPGNWARLAVAGPSADGTGPAHHVLHREASGQIDGAAVFRLPWSADPAHAGELQVSALEALDDQAYRALWGLLTDFDLTRHVVAARRPVDEPLRWMLTNSRAPRITRTRDNLWLRILDIPRALGARAYASTDALVLEVRDDIVGSGQWRLEAGPEGAQCTADSSAAADLSLDVAELGSLYLGGLSAVILARAGRVREHTSGAASRLDALLRQERAPHNALGF